MTPVDSATLGGDLQGLIVILGLLFAYGAPTAYA
jgi:hypothetical protein